jgi:hypothetical protein
MTFERAVLKEGGEIPLAVAIQPLAKPPEDRSSDISDLLRGTVANQTVAGLSDNATGCPSIWFAQLI